MPDNAPILNSAGFPPDPNLIIPLPPDGKDPAPEMAARITDFLTLRKQMRDAQAAWQASQAET